MACTALVVVWIRSVLYFMLCVRNSKSIYAKLFSSVRDTSIRFFELNPLGEHFKTHSLIFISTVKIILKFELTGRILNRFSKDTNNMDEMLTLFLYEFMQISMVILGALVVPISVNPWMVLPLIPLGILFYVIQNYFVTTGRELKRLDNIGRSPIFVHTNSTIEGISTIRSGRKGELLTSEFDSHNDYHTRAYFGFFAVHRWFGLRLDFLCSVYTILTLFACIFLKGTSSKTI